MTKRSKRKRTKTTNQRYLDVSFYNFKGKTKWLTKL